MTATPLRAGATLAGREIAVRIELARPLIGHQGNISVIELKEPNLGDYIDCGPLLKRIAHDNRATGGELRIEVVEDQARLMAWTVRLSGLPEALLRTLGPKDARAVLTEVARLVEEFDAGNSRSAPTSSSSSSA